MPDQPAKPFYLTTPIYYVNARPHIGHAYTTIVADVIARRHRLQGDDVFFLTGTDEHGQKIERSAAAAGVPPQEFTDQISAQFQSLWDRMGLTYNKFIRTTDPAHKRGAQHLFAELYKRNQIYLSTYTGSYCVSDEAFVDAPAGTPCPDCGRLLETVTEENFFFKLSEYQDKIIARIESNELLITPDSARNEVLSFVRSGLKDLSISRSSFTWGIPVPEPAASESKQKHVIYVWLDALANYLTALGYGSEGFEDPESMFHKFWPAELHLVGKEITRFHCVYWPAFLMAAGLPLPKAITANGWLLFDNAKMSKSRGNVVRTETILEGFGEHVYAKPFPESTKAERDLFASDVLRYHLLREIPFGQDGSFSFDAMITRYNADLANGYGNLVSRTLKLVETSFAAQIPNQPSEPYRCSPSGDAWATDRGASTDDAFLGTRDIQNTFEDLLSLQRSAAPRNIFDLGGIALRVSFVDRYISFHKPWLLAKSPNELDKSKLEEVLYTSVEAIRISTALLYPYIPFTAGKVWTQLGLDPNELTSYDSQLTTLAWGGLKPGTKLGPLSAIFPRADKGLAQIMTDMENPSTPQPETSKFDHSKLETHQTPSFDPAAGPRTASLDGPAGTLTVGGSSAHTTHSGPTPSHTEAHASGIFAPKPASPNPETSSEITIDDFAKIDLRVAQIVVCERIPKADKLLRLEVDLGPLGQRQILSGIAEFYTPEELVGRRIVIIANLAPRKMRGLESHGMLLAASEGDHGRPSLATCGDDIALGSRLK